MPNIAIPDVLQLASVAPRVAHPAQQNRSLWTGRSKILGLPGAEYWTGKAVFRVLARENYIRQARAFFYALRGKVNTFDLPVTPTPQVLTGSHPYGGHATALDFKRQVYVRGGARLAALANWPGYSFTRSGEQGAVDSDGGVDYFAANVPAINGKGFHAYDALTNSLLQSQAADDVAWSKANLSVAANAVTAPDGTTTGDTLTRTGAGSQVRHITQSSARTNGETRTFARAMKMGTNRYVQVAFDGAFQPANAYANFDLQTGAVAFTGAGLVGAYIVPLSDGWYFCIAVSTVTATGSGSVYVLPVDSGAAAFTAAGADDGSTFHVWQAQELVGHFADGGPIIRTTGAAASIGSSSIRVNDAVGADADQMFIVKARQTLKAGAQHFVSWFPSSGYTSFIVLYQSGNALVSFVNIGGATAYSTSVTVSAGFDVKWTLVLVRRAGTWRFGIVNDAGVLTWAGPAAAAGFPPDIGALIAGYDRNWSATAPDGPVRLVARKLGTFDTDQKVLDAVAEGTVVPPSPLVGATVTAGGAQGARSMTLSTTVELLPGMFGAVPLPSGHQRLFVVTSIVGNVISFEPSMPESVAAGAVVEFLRPAIRARLSDPEFSYEDTQGTVTFVCDVEEAL